MLIEQAIFTSAQTPQAEGYQLVRRSPGLAEADARQLTLWGPSHDSLLERSGRRLSTNFFKLDSGAYCVSRTAPAGAEFSGRGEVVTTQFLVVPPEVLARFGNNPFALVRAALASGAMTACETIPETLAPLRLVGRASRVDLSLLAQLARDPGPSAMATLVQAVLACDRLAIAVETSAEQLIAGLFSILPVECRPDFSFSTGLKPSPGRPVRISFLPNDPASWRGMDRQGFTLLNLADAKKAAGLAWQGWAGCVAEILASGRLSLLAGELEQSRPWLDCDKLHLLAAQVQERLKSAGQQGAAEVPGEGRQTPASGAPANDAPPLPELPRVGEPANAATAGGFKQRADAAHARGDGAPRNAKKSVPNVTLQDLSEVLAGQPPAVLEMLERVDDLVFAAIAGDERALAELEVLWPVTAAELDSDLVEKSREQYLRCALSIWGECVAGTVRQPERAVAAIDVLCVLFEE